VTYGDLDPYLSDHRIPPAEISSREQMVLRCYSHGMRRNGVASLLGITTETVKWHNHNARLKLRAKNTTHAVALAIRQGLL
jgi:LuxR family transcriptional activator of conjugal transfer of Ti plasmids